MYMQHRRQYSSANQYVSIAARARATTYVRPRPRAPLGGNEAREAKEAREQVAGWTNTDTRG